VNAAALKYPMKKKRSGQGSDQLGNRRSTNRRQIELVIREEGKRPRFAVYWLGSAKHNNEQGDSTQVCRRTNFCRGSDGLMDTNNVRPTMATYLSTCPTVADVRNLHVSSTAPMSQHSHNRYNANISEQSLSAITLSYAGRKPCTRRTLYRCSHLLSEKSRKHAPLIVCDPTLTTRAGPHAVLRCFICR